MAVPLAPVPADLRLGATLFGSEVHAGRFLPETYLPSGMAAATRTAVALPAHYTCICVGCGDEGVTRCSRETYDTYSSLYKPSKNKGLASYMLSKPPDVD